MNSIPQFHPDIVNLLVGASIGAMVGLIFGYIIWSRNKSTTGALGDLKWSQIIASFLVVACLLMRASDAITISLVALIPAEAVAISLARRADKNDK